MKTGSPGLALVGYWNDSVPGEPPSIWPDPRDLVVVWPEPQRKRVLRYLRAGHIRVMYLGDAHCRFGCTKRNGSRDLWDGTFVWPDGLAHYVAKHSVGLPESFLRHMEAHGFRVPPVAGLPSVQIRDEAAASDFLRWAASRAPVPAPREGTLSLEQARARAATLSTTTTPFTIDDFCGWWRVRGGEMDGYFPALTPSELERKILRHRSADAPISATEANALAARSCGPDLQVRYGGWLGAEFRWLVTVTTVLGGGHSSLENATDALGVEALVRLERDELERELARPLTLAEARSRCAGLYAAEEIVDGGEVVWRFTRRGLPPFDFPRPDRRGWQAFEAELFKRFREAES